MNRCAAAVGLVLVLALAGGHPAAVLAQGPAQEVESLINCVVNGVRQWAKPSQCDPAKPERKSEDLPPAIQQAIDRNRALGYRIYRQDFAAAAAFDELLRLNVLGRDERLKGWITDDDPRGAVTVLFVGDAGGQATELYSVAIEAGRVVAGSYTAFDPPAPLNEARAAQFRARRLAKSSDHLRCAARYNTVALPADGRNDGAFHVYVLAATSDPRLYLFGGHHRYTISADGNTVEEHRAFTKGCLNMERKGGGAIPLISHLLDPYPTEVHLFLSLLYRTKIAVYTETNKTVWEVERGRVLSAYKGEPGDGAPK
jgi:hypothetical protein